VQEQALAVSVAAVPAEQINDLQTQMKIMEELTQVAAQVD
jgi:hypothetical protein